MGTAIGLLLIGYMAVQVMPVLVVCCLIEKLFSKTEKSQDKHQKSIKNDFQ